METKHTKGNWAINIHNTIVYRQSNQLLGDYKSICALIPPYYEETNEEKVERLANAKLIASAPKLLEALIEAQKTLLIYISNAANDGSANGRVLAEIENAIKQATK